MTDIRILELRLENFKNHRRFELNLAGRNGAIYGDNATGKTSVYDSLLWLLFDKDSSGNGGKNMEIKPLGADGEVLDHDALTSVEAVLSVNGESVTLKRTYKEVWTTKRGSSEATYDGNTSEYFVDGVPMKANAFKDAVRAMVEEETFMMLTSVGYFASALDWKKRREALFRLSGITDDRMILCTDERFQPLMEAMGRSDLEGLKRKLAADKKGLSVNKSELPVRISECETAIASLSGLDFQDARQRQAELQKECDGLSGQILSLTQSAELRELQADLKEANLEKDRITAENELYRKKQTGGTVDVLGLNLRVTSKESLLVAKRNALATENKYIALMDSKIEGFRNQWIAVNKEEFHGDMVCPTCGQDLPALQLQVAKDSWAEDKRKRLDTILRDADTCKENKAMAEERRNGVAQEIAEMEKEIESLRQQIAAANANHVEPKDMDGYEAALAGVQGKIDGINRKIFDLQNNAASAKQALELELQGKKDHLREVAEMLAKESLLKTTEERVKSLREDARRASEALDTVEKLLFLLEEYTRYKTSFVEDTINSLFRLAHFRLFRAQANGGVEERCDVVYEGVPYNSVNNGTKINLGIDIINTLSVAYGVRVPLFVDNAESVTELEHCHSQRIRLVVSENDKELRVKYEDS